MTITLPLAGELTRRLRELPVLPAKFGFAIDTGPAAILGAAPADIRIERGPHGLILRADGMARGEYVTAANAITRAIELAHWFAARAGEATRMARLVSAGETPELRANDAPLTVAPLRPGGRYRAVAFGRLNAGSFRDLAAAPIRLTPWRGVLAEGDAALPVHDDLIGDPGDPACVSPPVSASPAALRPASGHSRWPTALRRIFRRAEPCMFPAAPRVARIPAPPI